MPPYSLLEDETGTLQEGGKIMFELLLSHWATYLFLVWVTVCVVWNLMLIKKNKPDQPKNREPLRA